MNPLERYINEWQLDQFHVMEQLQLANIISDNCVLASDVAEADCAKAIEFLKVHNP